MREDPAAPAGRTIGLKTAGERERGSLDPLRLNPVGSGSLIAGKWLAASLFGCGALLLATASSLVMFRVAPWHEINVQMRVTDRDLLGAALMMLPIALLMNAAATFVSALSRSFQQAQSYARGLMVATIVPGLLMAVFPVAHAAWAMPIPIVGQLALTTDLLTGQHPAAYRLALPAAGAVLPSLVLTGAAADLLRRESIVFRGA